MGCFHVTSSPPCWWMKTKDLSFAPFVRPPAIVHYIIVILSLETGCKPPIKAFETAPLGYRSFQRILERLLPFKNLVLDMRTPVWVFTITFMLLMDYSSVLITQAFE